MFLLIFYLCNEEALSLFELYPEMHKFDDSNGCVEWIFDLFGDMDVVTFLYSNIFLKPDDIYHFSHWSEQHFFN